MVRIGSANDPWGPFTRVVVPAGWHQWMEDGRSLAVAQDFGSSPWPIDRRRDLAASVGPKGPPGAQPHSASVPIASDASPEPDHPLRTLQSARQGRAAVARGQTLPWPHHPHL